jgi:hypothetical protein
MSTMPKAREIAEALGLSPGRISQLRRDGMPVDSIEAARAWYSRRVDLARSLGQRNRPVQPRRARAEQPSGEAALGRVVVLAARAEVALAVGRFAEIEPGLRAALADVPPEHRPLIELSMPLWEALCGDVLAVVREFAEPGDAAVELPPEDLSRMAAFWHAVACGHVRPAGERLTQ